MFVDSHCHLTTIAARGENLADLLTRMGDERFAFALDIGTKPGDFAERVDAIRAAVGTIPSFLHFSCGLWPDATTIADRVESLKILDADLRSMIELAESRQHAVVDGEATPSAPGSAPIIALGECGLDRHWNGPQAAERPASAADAEDGPGTTDLAGEEELFEGQLELAKKYKLPVIVHSRDAFDATLACLRNMDSTRGVIHCFSYGVDEARAFLDLGWHISFPGNVTWPKREADKERVASIVRYVPRDRLLLETDAPYLAPAPHRGTVCVPPMIERTYARVAEILGLPIASLAALVLQNSRELFVAR